MSERRFSTMTPHRLMPHSIPRTRERKRHWPVPVSHQINRRSADDPYGAGFDGDVSRHVFEKPSRVNPRPKRFDEYIRFVEVIPGEPLVVTAQLSGVTITGEFVPQPAKRPTDTLVLAAKARIGLQKGFFAVSAGSKILNMRVEYADAARSLQEVSVEMPLYDPNKLVVEYRNSLVIASA